MEQKNIRLNRELFERHKRELKELNDFISKIKSLLNEKLTCVVLIGSRARLDFNIKSDIDIIIVGFWTNEILFNRINEIKESIEIPLLPVDFFLYRPKEILMLIEQGNPMILDGFTEGVCLLNNDYYQKIQNIIKEKIAKGYFLKDGKTWKIQATFK